MMVINGRAPSPCIGCGKKNYAGGCHIGCKRRDNYLADNAEAARQKRLAAAAGDVRTEGIERSRRSRLKR